MFSTVVCLNFSPFPPLTFVGLMKFSLLNFSTCRVPISIYLQIYREYLDTNLNFIFLSTGIVNQCLYPPSDDTLSFHLSPQLSNPTPRVESIWGFYSKLLPCLRYPSKSVPLNVCCVITVPFSGPRSSFLFEFPFSFLLKHILK